VLLLALLDMGITISAQVYREEAIEDFRQGSTLVGLRKCSKWPEAKENFKRR
jgi:hypothetical protein